VAGLLAVTLAWAGGLDGWISTWHASRGRWALERALQEPGSAQDLAPAVRELAAALALNPLRRRFRFELESAVGAAVDRAGAAATAALAPAATLPRVVFATVLEGRGQGELAAGVLSGVGATRAEEIEMMSAATLQKVAKRVATSGRCAAALPLLEAAVGQVPDDPGLDLNYAACLTRTGDPARAMPLLRHVYELDPGSKWVHFLFAEAHLALGEVTEADSQTEWLTTHEAGFSLGWRLRGDVLAAANRPVEAGICYHKALELSPESTWLKWPIAEMEKRAKSRERGSS